VCVYVRARASPLKHHIIKKLVSSTGVGHPFQISVKILITPTIFEVIFLLTFVSDSTQWMEKVVVSCNELTVPTPAWKD
jgi:hypothetical protein